MKVSISFPMGCPRSMLDAALLVEYCTQNGWDLVKSIEDADAVIVGTCGFNAQAEDISFNYLSLAASRKTESAKLITFGCLSRIQGTRLRDAFTVLPVSRWDWDILDARLGATVSINAVSPPNDLEQYSAFLTNTFSPLDESLCFKLTKHPRVFQNYIAKHLSGPVPDLLSCLLSLKNRRKPGRMEHYTKIDGEPIFNIRIATGCLEQCAYCAIKIAMGSVKSLPLDSVLCSFERGLSGGYSRFRLVAEDVGAYGQDIGSSVVELLELLLGREDQFRLIIDDFHPKWLIRYQPELSVILERHAGKIQHLGLPLQSGSDRILRAMKRDYCVTDFTSAIKNLRQVAPGLRLCTHVVLGFPGEDEEDVEQTIELLRTLHFEQVTIYEYGDRPNTTALDLPGKVSDRRKRARLAKVRRALSEM